MGRGKVYWKHSNCALLYISNYVVLIDKIWPFTESSDMGV